jgi:hypothetical protein
MDKILLEAYAGILEEEKRVSLLLEKVEGLGPNMSLGALYVNCTGYILEAMGLEKRFHYDYLTDEFLDMTRCDKKAIKNYLRWLENEIKKILDEEGMA